MNNRVPGAAAGSEKLDSSNPILTHSGTGEKETLNTNVVGTKENTFVWEGYILVLDVFL
jgi:hypothetical protein